MVHSVARLRREGVRPLLTERGVEGAEPVAAVAAAGARPRPRAAGALGTLISVTVVNVSIRGMV